VTQLGHTVRMPSLMKTLSVAAETRPFLRQSADWANCSAVRSP
jgi:hypothetical protein